MNKIDSRTYSFTMRRNDMANLALELNVNSASNLSNVNLFTKMHVYTKIVLDGENTRNIQKAKTNVARGSNPSWNHPVKFSINEVLARANCLTLVMRVISRRRVLGDKDIGKVIVPVLDLLNSDTNPNCLEMKSKTYQIINASVKRSGCLTFSYRFIPEFFSVFNNLRYDEIGTCPPPAPIEPPSSSPPEFPFGFSRLPQRLYVVRRPVAARVSEEDLQ